MAEVGVGTVAAGVAKAHADVVLISGHDGGTGASPVTSHQAFRLPLGTGIWQKPTRSLLNNLRSRIIVQTDGQLKTGRDVVIAALLGAEEFGFATAPLVTLGLHPDAQMPSEYLPGWSRHPGSRFEARFAGKPEHVINFLLLCGGRGPRDHGAIGHSAIRRPDWPSDLLDVHQAIEHWKASGLDLAPILNMPKVPRQVAVRCVDPQDHGIDQILDVQLIRICRKSAGNTEADPTGPAYFQHRPDGLHPLERGDRQALRAGGAPEDTIQIKFSGSAGQSFGAFLAHGITLTLEGDANDYTGKGLSGGRMIIYPPRGSAFVPEENILIGNTVLYGATGGEAFFRGVAGERFAVRNSGAQAVVEGVGDHGCEYMTGGMVVVLGTPAGILLPA